MKVSRLKKNPNNPRVIRDEKFEQLKNSIRDFPEMMELRPMVVDESNTILGGNMRLEAIKALGLKEIPDSWVKRAGELTDEQKRQFVIKDNVSFGTWDFDILANEFDQDLLTAWGLDLPVPASADIDLADFYQESAAAAVDNDKIVLEYTKEDCERVRAGLRSIDGTFEKAVWKLLGL
jgi:hypothetical protein